jgi:uncharacterized protein (DUF4415 family)
MTARTPKIVSYTPPDSGARPKAQREELRALAKRPDEKIDFSDIAELDDLFFENALRGDTYRPTKKQLTLRLDTPTLDWFRRKYPRGYQTEINKVLLQYILGKQREARKKAG